jgi:hypothetical protein
MSLRRWLAVVALGLALGAAVLGTPAPPARPSASLPERALVGGC